MFFSLLLAATMNSGFAQSPQLTNVPTDQPTTIQITKGTTSDRDYDVLSNSADIAGDPDVSPKAARASWKKACSEWKSEIKGLNKENHLLAINCNTPRCPTESTNTTCTSTGNYQIRVKIKDTAKDH